MSVEITIGDIIYKWTGGILKPVKGGDYGCDEFKAGFQIYFYLLHYKKRLFMHVYVDVSSFLHYTKITY